MTPSRRHAVSEFLLIGLVGVPVLGILMGGVYSVPAMALSKEREPWLSLLLGAGLAITVFGGGVLGGAPLAHLVGAWAGSIALLLLARKVYGSLGHNLERFGIVHMAASVLTVLVVAAARRALVRAGG